MENGKEEVIMVGVGILNLTKSSQDAKFVRKVIRGTLRKMGEKGRISVGVVFVSKNRIQEINRKYRGKNNATDVLSFPVAEQFIISGKDEKCLGEIVVCLPIVKKHAQKIGVTFNRELAHILIHGTLHLLVHEHNKSDKDAEKMHRKEEEIMDAIL